MPALRSARRTDAAAVAALHIASWRATYRGQLPDAFLDYQSLAERTAEWEARFGVPETHLLLVEDSETLLGFAAFGPSRDADADPRVVWQLYNLHVLPERRGGGLGLPLFQAAADQGAREGRERLTLWVVEQNWPARRFYQRQGMHPDGATQLHQLGPDVGLREVRYVRTLEA
ncbi:MAG TPA: GNAT family N-acetyltransferase [Gemmatimonadales bacterium]|nr:GNAT family N-acetyltransferase [Gemmatimonadales bacterium]